MATRIIPEISIFTCDACKVENAPQAGNGRLLLTCKEAVGETPASSFNGMSWELCDECTVKVKTMVSKGIGDMEKGK